VGRFTGVDPIADEFPWVTPYNYAENRPVNGVDLWGLQYLDANLKIELEKTTIKVSGRLDVNVKIINLSSSSPKREFMDYHDQKSSKAFDNLNTLTYTSNVPLDPNTGKMLNKNFRIEGNVDINFKFIAVENSLNKINKGDVVLLLVDELLGNKGTAGVTDKGGHAYAIEANSFNKKYHIDTHEKGHLIGNLLDIRGKDAPKGFLMSYGDDGQGYNLKMSERREIIDNLIYSRALSKLGLWGKERDTRDDAEDLIKKHVKKR
jgi:hypothetical protein